MFKLDSHTNNGWKTNQGDYSFNHTVASGANLLIVACATFHDPASKFLDGVTYDSVAMTKAVGETNTGSGDNFLRVEMWYLLNPSSGTNSVSVDINGANADTILTTATSFYGSKNLSPLDDSDGYDNNSQVATATVDLTAGQNNTLFMDMIIAENTNTGEPTDPTRTGKLFESTYASQHTAASSYILNVDAGTDTYNYPVGGTDYMSYVGVLFKPGPSGGSLLFNFI